MRRGWALAAQGRVTEGLDDLHQGLAYREAVGAIVGRSYDPIFLAEVYARTGQVEEGLHVLAEMRVAVDNSGFRCLEAEIYRLTGALLLQQAIPNAPQAEAHFEQALEVARHQQAKSLELRAAMSLARLWNSRASAPRPGSSWRQSTVGSPRALTPPTSRTPRHCWKSALDNDATGTVGQLLSIQADLAGAVGTS